MAFTLTKRHPILGPSPAKKPQIRTKRFACSPKAIIVLTETIRLMPEIDEVIEAHGGWPNAFQTASDDD